MQRFSLVLLTLFRLYLKPRPAEYNLWHNRRNTGILRQMQWTPAANVSPGFPLKEGLKSQQLTGTKIWTRAEFLNWNTLAKLYNDIEKKHLWINSKTWFVYLVSNKIYLWAPWDVKQWRQTDVITHWSEKKKPSMNEG